MRRLFFLSRLVRAGWYKRCRHRDQPAGHDAAQGQVARAARRHQRARPRGGGRRRRRRRRRAR
eukprot:4077372-Prymnesium_polylepis.1